MNSIEAPSGRIEKILPRIPKGVAVVMLNMLRFKKSAAYPDARPGISGRQAYAAYSEGAMAQVEDVGGRVIWFGRARGTVIGPPDETWDHIFLVRYPSIERFMEMVSRPAYRELLVHRTAALEDSRLILTLEV